YCTDLKAMEARLATTPPTGLPAPKGDSVEDRFIEIDTPTVKARLDRRRGLAIVSASFAPDFKPLIGGIPHGYFDEIALQADWYTGDCVFEAPGDHKVTDLEWCEARIEKMQNGTVIAHARIETPKGIIEKQMHFSAVERRIDFDISFHWSDWGKGVLRLGH